MWLKALNDKKLQLQLYDDNVEGIKGKLMAASDILFLTVHKSKQTQHSKASCCHTLRLTAK